MCDAEIVREFLVESYENLDRLDHDLVSLEGAPSDKEILAGIFRTIHTIKGTAGFLSFSKLEKLTHVGENLLARLRDGELQLNPEITTSLLAMVDAVRAMLASVENVGNEGERDDQELIVNMTRLFQLKTETVQASIIDPKDKDNDNDVRPTMLLHELPVGEILVSLGAAKESDIHAAVKKQNAGDRRQVGELLVEAGAVTPQDVLDALNVQQIARGPSASDSTVRVDVNLLDRLMNLVSELVLTRNQILKFTSSAKASILLPTSQRLNLITTELQEGVMKPACRQLPTSGINFPAPSAMWH
jgi:two-component system chemotaxis sensor kinase CheA